MKYHYAERLLTVDKLGLTLGGKPVLHNICLEIDNVVVDEDTRRPDVKQGQVVALLGPSGIGKTQLFRCIAGLNEPTTGAVLINSDHHPVKPGEVGVVQQTYPLMMHRTVWSNLRMVTADEARIVELTTRFNLADHLKKYPSELSGGQRQRVAIIQQMLRNNYFILMDEPFSGLDIVAKNNVCRLIQEVSTADELSTIIFTTHDIESAFHIADTLWIMGRVYDAGSLLGATIVRKINLITEGIAWNPEFDKHPRYRVLIDEIKTLFPQL